MKNDSTSIPNSSSRQGLVLVSVIVCLLVATAMILNLVQATILLSRQTTHQAQRLQLQILTNDAISYALIQHQKDPAYRGETWDISAEQWMLSDPGQVSIQVNENNKDEILLNVEGTILINDQALQKITRTIKIK